jgi:hypothetical protein
MHHSCMFLTRLLRVANLAADGMATQSVDALSNTQEK